MKTYEYIIRDDTLYVVEPALIPQALGETEWKQFDRALDEKKVGKARAKISDRLKLDTPGLVRYRAKVEPAVAEEYRTKLEDERNQLLIHPCLHNGGDGRPLLPGSSLKGAIRTAVLDGLAHRQGVTIRTGGDRHGKNAERDIIGSRRLEEDPFRCLKVRDCCFPDGSTRVAGVANVGRDGREKMQVIQAEMFTEDSETEVEILLDDVTPTRYSIKNPFTLEEAMAACRAFYEPRLERESEKFYRGLPEAAVAAKRALEESRKESCCLVRVGRFSQIECMRFDPELMDRDPVRRKGSTRNLAGGKLPMGWVRLRVLDPSPASP